MDPLFPELPEDLTTLTDEELDTLLAEHNVAAELLDKGDEDFTKDLSPEDELAQYEQGIAQIEAIKGEQKARVEAAKEFEAKKAALAERRQAALADAEETVEDEDDEEQDDEAKKDLAAETEVAADAEVGDEPAKEDEEEEKVAAAAEADTPVVAASVRQPQAAVRMRRSAPATSPDRMPAESQAVLTAAAGVEGMRSGTSINDRMKLAGAIRDTAARWGRVSKHEGGMQQRILIASATFSFPEDRKLHPSDWGFNSKKIADVVPAAIPGVNGVPLEKALVASGGLCAPLEPIYSMPNFASTARPVRDALPSFQADRGGVNVPTATYIADITTAITVIEEEEDALGGTFATKSCQDLTCPAYTETAVTVISHCREYGNLNAIAWPEKIAHENDLTMAAHARTAETYLLDRIKAQSLQVTNGAETLGALIYLVDGIVKATEGIRYRLRMDSNARFRALLPAYLPGLLALDTVQTNDGNRFQSKAALTGYLQSLGIEPAYYLDPVTGATPFAAETTSSTLDALPDTIQWAIFPEGAFIHLDMGSLELGIVRDSTLNSTNDHQLFGESFENVARIAPQQATLWVTSDLCANGQFPPAGTARTCD